ncbi:unnamed protein product, partial [Brachionus calyciflorus]
EETNSFDLDHSYIAEIDESEKSIIIVDEDSQSSSLSSGLKIELTNSAI